MKATEAVLGMRVRLNPKGLARHVNAIGNGVISRTPTPNDIWKGVIFIHKDGNIRPTLQLAGYWEPDTSGTVKKQN